MAVQQEEPVALGLQVGQAGQHWVSCVLRAGGDALPTLPVIVRAKTLDLEAWVCILALPFTGCVALGKLLSLSEPQIPQLLVEVIIISTS